MSCVLSIPNTLSFSISLLQEHENMQNLTIRLPDNAFSALRLSPTEFIQEMRIAAAVQWYAQQEVTQGKAAELAGLSRTDFLAELFRRKVPAIQVTLDELEQEIHDSCLDRKCLTTDFIG